MNHRCEEPSRVERNIDLLLAEAIDRIEVLERRMDTMSDAMNAIAAAVAHVSNAVAGVADRLRNHPAASDDATLKDMATQLESAAETLDGIAADPANAAPAPVQAPGTTTEPTTTTDETPPVDEAPPAETATEEPPAGDQPPAA